MGRRIGSCKSIGDSSPKKSTVARVDLVGKPRRSLLPLNEPISLLDLWPECYTKIFDYLETKDLNSVSLTCHQLNQSIKVYLTPTLLSLSNKCMYEIFKWLSLQNIYIIGQTCNRLRQVAGEYFQANYPSSLIVGNECGIYTHGMPLNDFSEFVMNISILSGTLREFNYFRSCNFSSLRRINLAKVEFPTGVADTFKEILIQIEVLEVVDCEISEDFCKFLKNCPKLQKLSLRNRTSDVIAGTGNQWLLRPHPSLQHLKMVHKKGIHIEELKTFFVRNRNVRSFATQAVCLWDNRNIISIAKPKFDLIEIDVDKCIKSRMATFCKLLNEFHQKGIFKRLHLNTRYVDRHSIKKIATLQGLERLHFVNSDERNIENLHTLVNVKELGISVSCHIAGIKTMATSLKKLERIYFYQAITDDLLVFIKYSKKLREINVERLPYGIHFRRGVIDMVALNEERKTLFDAAKITLYIPENVFLLTKWSMNSTDFGLIEIKKNEEWPEPF